MLRPVRTEKIIREINGAEFPKSEFCCGYENLVFVEIDGLGVIQKECRVRTRGGDHISMTEFKQQRTFLCLLNTKRYFVMTAVISLGNRIPCGMCFTAN